MIVRDEIHGLFGIKEPHELPSAMMAAIHNPNVLNVVFENYKSIFPDLTQDVLRDYFQEDQADRSNLMQDYTPESLCQICAALTGRGNRVADLCAGTGSLTLGVWQQYPGTEFICYEKSSASIPFLLFNLGLRKIDAYVIQGDLLTEETERIYRVHNGEIEEVEDYPRDKVDAVVTNPPYSLKWSGSHDLRFGLYSTPPKGFADYAFLLIGLDMLKPGGTMAAILPHGILFRGGGAEEKIRTELIKDRRIETVIGLPPKLFANTQIPVAVVVFKESNDGIYFIDAKDEFKESRKQNAMLEEHVETVLSAYKLRKEIDKLSHLATYEEIEENGCNLNIPRFVDAYEIEVLAPPSESLREIIKTHQELKRERLKLLETMQQLQTKDGQTGKEFKEFVQLFEEWANL